MKFEPIRPNPDLDVHPNPLPGWDRVVVACGWRDGSRGRRDWPHAAVVAPLRTVRGFDELLRNLLHNPQVRILVTAGPDLTPGESTWTAFRALWVERDLAHLSEDLLPHLGLLWARDEEGHPGVGAFYRHDFVEYVGEPSLAEIGPRLNLPTRDRPGGRISLPPPQLVVSRPAPHGDPGDRVAADVLSDLHPRILRQVMGAGREVETQYGMTREALNLVTVIRDPAASAEEARQDRPTLAYYERLLSGVVPEGAPYTYGSRLCGNGYRSRVATELLAGAAWIREQGGPEAAGLALGLQVLGQSASVHQLDRIRALLEKNWATRAAFLTPWNPEEDAGIESGRPCLVGLSFRATGTWGGRVRSLVTGREGAVCGWTEHGIAVRLDDKEEVESVTSAWELLTPILRPELHATVIFRSHELFAAYPQNLGAICLLLVDWSRDLGLEVGSVTCVSSSAHVYERDWPDALALVEAYRRRGLRMDPRSTWVIEAALEPCPSCAGRGRIVPPHDAEIGDGEWLGRGGACEQCGEHLISTGLEGRWTCPRGSEPSTHEVDCLTCRGVGGRRTGIRATALTPDGADVVRIFEAPTGAALRAQLEESGLFQEVGNALWVGSEIHRVESGR